MNWDEDIRKRTPRGGSIQNIVERVLEGHRGRKVPNFVHECLQMCGVYDAICVFNVQHAWRWLYLRGNISEKVDKKWLEMLENSCRPFFSNSFVFYSNLAFLKKRLFGFPSVILKFNNFEIWCFGEMKIYSLLRALLLFGYPKNATA